MIDCVSPFSHDCTVESISPFKAILCKEWFENVHRYEPKEKSHNIRLSKEYSIHSWCEFDCLTLHQHIASHNLSIETDIKDICTDNEFLTISLDTGIRIQIPIEKSVKTISYLKVNKVSSLCGCKQKNEVSELQFLRSDSPKNAHGLNLFSSSSLYLKIQSSTPCAIDANSLHFTFFSKYSIISGESVTVKEIFFVLSIQESFLSKVIYTFVNHSCLTRIMRVGESQYDKKQPISESYGSVHSSAGKDSIQWNNSRDSLHRGLSFGYVHRRTEIDNRRQSESGNNNIHRPDIQIGDREEAFA